MRSSNCQRYLLYQLIVESSWGSSSHFSWLMALFDSSTSLSPSSNEVKKCGSSTPVITHHIPRVG